MAYASRTFLVRHGAYKNRPEELKPYGVRQLERATDTLLAAGVGATAVILASNAPRTYQSADVIAQGLGVTEHFYATSILDVAGQKPSMVDKLSTLVSACYLGQGFHDVHGEPPFSDRDLVVVSHLPLMAAVAGNEDFGNGQVYELAAEDWENPQFDGTLFRNSLQMMAEHLWRQSIETR